MLNLLDVKTYRDMDFNSAVYREDRSGPFAHICPYCKTINFIE